MSDIHSIFSIRRAKVDGKQHLLNWILLLSIPNQFHFELMASIPRKTICLSKFNGYLASFLLIKIDSIGHNSNYSFASKDSSISFVESAQVIT